LQAWTAEAGVDISVCLNKYKKHYKDGRKEKIREIVLTVRDDVRIDLDQANDLFDVVKKALETNTVGLELEPWHRAHELSSRQMVWTHKSDAGRKAIRPIVEDAVINWD
jgi:exopolyphosphatase